MELEDLIRDDEEHETFRVHRSVMTSPEIFRLEQERIFRRSWLYLGHESEVPDAGDFRRRTVNGRPMFFVRGADGEIRAFFNTCTHRGATICRQDGGNSRHFQCFYHAWTFSSEGDLVTIPDEQGFSERFDRSSLALVRPAGTESYRGFLFVTFNPDAPSLSEHLGGAKEYIDLIVDQSEAGWRVVPGTNRYGTRANWKLLVENTIDTYHVAPLHVTYFQYLQSIGAGRSGTGGPGPRELDGGHVVIEAAAPYARPIARWDPLFPEDAKPDIEAIRNRLVNRHGAERAERMCDNFRLLVIYPNLVLNDISAVTIRYIQPVAPGHMETTAWALAPSDEDSRALARRLDSYITFIGPGGLATPDDIEAAESCQLGFECMPEVEWNDLSRGVGQAPRMNDDSPIRAFWRRWHVDILDAGRDPSRGSGESVSPVGVSGTGDTGR